MPDLIGKSYFDAESWLVQYNVRITRRTEVSPDAVGVVIRQDPAPGAPFAQDVMLTVSVAPATVPNVVGMTYGDAELALRQRGLRVEESPRFDDTKADGLVVEQDPPAGSENAGLVRLAVIRRAVELYLSDTEAVDSDADASNGFVRANGKDYSHGVAVDVSRGDSDRLEYDLSRQYRKLSGEIAISNSSPADSAARVEIYGDDRRLFAKSVKFGKTVDLDIDVTGVLRLRVLVTDVSSGNHYKPTTLVLGDVRAQGLPTEVTSPSPEPSES